jgi:hypothetical protein
MSFIPKDSAQTSRASHSSKARPAITTGASSAGALLVAAFTLIACGGGDVDLLPASSDGSATAGRPVRDAIASTHEAHANPAPASNPSAVADDTTYFPNDPPSDIPMESLPR